VSPGIDLMQGALIVCVIFAVVALLLALSRWLAGRPWAAAGNVAVALLLLYVAHGYWPAVLNLETYQSLPDVSGPVAQVHSERTGPRAYRVTLTRLPTGRMQVFEIRGDEWRIDSRTLAWQGRAAQLGLQPGHRFDRLSARYLRTAGAAAPAEGGSEVTLPLPASFELGAAEEPGVDVWAQARTGVRWASVVDARHAYGPWRPLADGARYDVWIVRTAVPGQSRLEARPANEAAVKAMGYTAPNKVRTQG
jgi:hypothetical protein